MFACSCAPFHLIQLLKNSLIFNSSFVFFFFSFVILFLVLQYVNCAVLSYLFPSILLAHFGILGMWFKHNTIGLFLSYDIFTWNLGVVLVIFVIFFHEFLVI